MAALPKGADAMMPECGTDGAPLWVGIFYGIVIAALFAWFFIILPRSRWK